MMTGSFYGPEMKFFPAFSRPAGKTEKVASARDHTLRLHRDGRGFLESGGLHLAQVAGDVVGGQDLAHLRLLLRAALEGVGAPGVEAAARWRVDRARHVAFEDDPLFRGLRVGDRD